MPCGAEALVRGDSREYCIGAASVPGQGNEGQIDARLPRSLAATTISPGTRDIPPGSTWRRCSGTGASPIHRRTFAPLKHMTFDGDGRILEDEDEEEE